MSVTLPAASLQLRPRYWSRGSVVSAGDTDLEGGQLGIVREAHYAYSETVGGRISGGSVNGILWASNVSAVTYESLGEAVLLVAPYATRITVMVHGRDLEFRLGTSLGDSASSTVSGAARTGIATYTIGAPYAVATEIRVWLDFRHDGLAAQGEIYRWSIYEEPLTVGELP